MSHKFLDYMTKKEYNDYHKELFGNEWKDVNHIKTRFTFWERIKSIFVKEVADE